MLYVVVEEHSGILLNIYRCLSGAGYRIVSNQFGKRSDDKTYVKLEIEEGAIPLPPELEGQLLNIKGCQDILYQEPDKASASKTSSTKDNLESVKAKVEHVATNIVNNFSKIGPLVQDFVSKCPEANRISLTYALGHQVGQKIYQRDYALGKPLKLELALKRMLSDAVSSFGKISCNQRMMSIDNNIFCNNADPANHCEFTKGFMTGFLHQSPKTNDAKVENISCRCQGQLSCSFEFR